MGNRQYYAKFQENLFRTNEIISIFGSPYLPTRTVKNRQEPPRTDKKLFFLINYELNKVKKDRSLLFHVYRPI